MRLILEIPDGAVLSLDAPQIYDAEEVEPTRYAAQPAGPAGGRPSVGVPAGVPLDIFHTTDEITYRHRMHDQPAGAGELLAFARLVPAAGGGNVWRTRVTMSAGPVDYDHAAEAHAAIRSHWTGNDVRMLTSPLYPPQETNQ